MNNITQFKKKDNLALLLEVLLDELQIDIQNKKVVSNIRTIFESNINPFINKTNPQNTLVDLNKLFLKQVSVAINRLMPNIKQESQIKKITISDEEINQPYTIEDIQAFRQNEFDRKLEQQRIDFENTINPKKPKEVDFTYNEKEGKITEMEHLIADTIARRNYELEEIQNKNYTSIEKAETWLNPQETSNKLEKVKNIMEVNGSNQKLKHISIEENGVMLNNLPKTQRNVSWSDIENDNVSLMVDDLSKNDIKPNIFSKLKQKPSNNQQISNNNSIRNNFIEDELQPIITPTTSPNTPVSILKSSNVNSQLDVQNQLNNMNKKIEDLQNMMKNIYELLEKKTIPIESNINNSIIEG
jgi:hypothetical protein